MSMSPTRSTTSARAASPTGCSTPSPRKHALNSSLLFPAAMDFRSLGLTVSAATAAAMVARILWLFANRVPVLAHSENTDVLGDTAPGDPLNPAQHPHGIASLSPFHETDMRVEYEVGGKK